AHPGAEVAAGLTDDDGAAARHVLAPVVAGAFDDANGATIADHKAFPGDAPEERRAARGAVERNVADDDVLFRHEGRVRRRENDDLAAGETFSDVVVRVTF